MVLTVHLCMYAVRNLDISDNGCPIKAHLKCKIFDTHLVFICNTFNHKSKISTNPKMMTFGAPVADVLNGIPLCDFYPSDFQRAHKMIITAVISRIIYCNDNIARLVKT